MPTFNIDARFVKLTDAVITAASYADGTVAIQAHSSDEPWDVETLSVNLGAYDMYPEEGHIYVPDYSENEGLPDALVEAGIATLVKRVHFGPFRTAGALMKLNDGVISS